MLKQDRPRVQKICSTLNKCFKEFLTKNLFFYPQHTPSQNIIRKQNKIQISSQSFPLFYFFLFMSLQTSRRILNFYLPLPQFFRYQKYSEYSGQNRNIQKNLNIINILLSIDFNTTKMQQVDKKSPKFNETDIYRVRKDSRLKEGLFLCKVILKKHGTVQIEGMGETISMVTKMSQILSKNGFTKLISLNSTNVLRENSKSINPKLTVKLQKSAEFDKLTESIQLKD